MPTSALSSASARRVLLASSGSRFLGVAAWEVSHGDVVGASDLVETTPYAQAETVLNYEEVVARLAPTAYAHLLQ